MLIKFVWGDNIKYSQTWTSYRKNVENYAEKLREKGGLVSTLDLPESGIYGNSHVPMMDLNSNEMKSTVTPRVPLELAEQQRRH